MPWKQSNGSYRSGAGDYPGSYSDIAVAGDSVGRDWWNFRAYAVVGIGVRGYMFTAAVVAIVLGLFVIFTAYAHGEGWVVDGMDMVLAGLIFIIFFGLAISAGCMD